MKMMKVAVMLLVMILLGRAQADVGILHSGANDPVTEGWEKDFYDIDPYFAWVFPIAPDPDHPTVDAWEIQSGSGGSSLGGKAVYQYEFNHLGLDPLAIGFTVEATARVKHDQDPAGAAQMFGVRGDGFMYQMWLRAKDGNTELMIYFSGGVTSWEALGPDSEYYKVKLVYDPVAASADFYINDSSVAIQNDLMPGATGATVQRVWWGQQDNGDQSRGNVYWNSVILNILTDPVCGDLGHPQPIGDLDGNCVVDIIDVTLMAAHWLERTFP